MKPSLIREHANIERATAQGGYGHRQLYELVQNGADALVASPGGRIEIVLTDDALYCANEGAAIDKWGVEAILSSHVSMKRGTEIGRFGLGFKSVLGVSKSPQFFSRSACFGFDATTAGERIREVVRDAERTPVLRLASPLDPRHAAAEDPVLAELMGWATTVVRLRRDVGDSSWVQEDIAKFPAEFLIFSPHVGTLVLNDRTSGTKRTIGVKIDGSSFRLIEGDEESEWRVYSAVHSPSDRAREDAGELSDRSALPVIWAVPTKTQRRRGAFWAFFPTTYETTLRGILNAPWKTNEDRQNLLEGAFNEELLDVAADLVVSHLNDLVDEDDPGRVLDYLPGRGDEARQWADRRLSAAVYSRAESKPSLPDQHGDLRLPTDLSLHPGSATPTALALWSGYQGRPLNWCHQSVSTQARRSRAERLLGNRQWAIANLRQWLEALVDDASPAGSSAAIEVAACLKAELTARDQGQLKVASIVLTESGRLVPAASPGVFIRGDREVVSDVEFVHPDVMANPEALEHLTKLGVEQVDPAHELRAAVNQIFGVKDWDSFWSLVRSVDPEVAEAILASRRSKAAPLKVRSIAGTFVPMDHLLLPGGIVPTDGSRDGAFAVDLSYHEDDLQVLIGLGMRVGPTAEGGRSDEHWFGDYRRAQLVLYEARLDGRRGRPQESKLQFEEKVFPGPLSPIARLSEEGRVRFTAEILNHHDALANWTLSHETRRDTYPVVSLDSPARWMVLRHGLVASSIGKVPLVEAVSSRLVEWAGALPVIRVSPSTTQLLGLPQSLEDLEEKHWRDAFARLGQHGDDPTFVSSFYCAGAVRDQDPGPHVYCHIKQSFELAPRADVTVVVASADAEALSLAGVPHLRCSTEQNAQILIDRFGLRSAAGVVTTEVDPIPSASEVLVTDEYPFLRDLGVNDDLQLVRCAVVHLVTRTPDGTTDTVVDQALHGNRFYWTDISNEFDLLKSLATAIDLDVTEQDLRRLLDAHWGTARAERVAEIAEHSSIPAKLLAAVGAPSLRRYLPTDLISGIEALEGELDEEGVASLFLAIHGVDTLKRLGDELEAAGLQPPRLWSGKPAAVSFVRDLGFPREYAGFEESRRSPYLEVDGPVDLEPLHDFQRQVGDELKSLLTAPEKNRGLLSLPTGAGKTRVAVQALIEAIADGTIQGPVLWVAQTDELCEQAVQTWSYVWRAMGPRSQLHISRLWASNEANPVESGAHVVVATTAKLGVRVQDPRYDWLTDPAVVVVDEAHSSTAPSYTALLNWLGLGRGRRARPLIGLTATPFRGRSESAAAELASRYGKNRLDAGAFEGDPYPILQDMGVLANVRHIVLGGTDISLTSNELEILRQTRRLPSSAEDRLGVDLDRNTVILDSILALPEDWTVLVFATSVGHAQSLAALLSLRGVPARTISAKTPPAARRHYVSEFRSGRIRVLTNYGVLTEGFDAPAVRAVYVGRPTFSPNLYQQMVGRGLRGPLNGGKPECLIVDVADNIIEYGGELAFRGFDHLWTS